MNTTKVHSLNVSAQLPHSWEVTTVLVQTQPKPLCTASESVAPLNYHGRTRYGPSFGLLIPWLTGLRVLKVTTSSAQFCLNRSLSTDSASLKKWSQSFWLWCAPSFGQVTPWLFPEYRDTPTSHSFISTERSEGRCKLQQARHQQQRLPNQYLQEYTSKIQGRSVQMNTQDQPNDEEKKQHKEITATCQLEHTRQETNLKEKLSTNLTRVLPAKAKNSSSPTETQHLLSGENIQTVAEGTEANMQTAGGATAVKHNNMWASIHCYPHHSTPKHLPALDCTHPTVKEEVQNRIQAGCKAAIELVSLKAVKNDRGKQSWGRLRYPSHFAALYSPQFIIYIGQCGTIWDGCAYMVTLIEQKPYSQAAKKADIKRNTQAHQADMAAFRAQAQASRNPNGLIGAELLPAHMRPSRHMQAPTASAGPWGQQPEQESSYNGSWTIPNGLDSSETMESETNNVDESAYPFPMQDQFPFTPAPPSSQISPPSQWQHIIELGLQAHQREADTKARQLEADNAELADKLKCANSATEDLTNRLNATEAKQAEKLQEAVAAKEREMMEEANRRHQKHIKEAAERSQQELKTQKQDMERQLQAALAKALESEKQRMNEETEAIKKALEAETNKTLRLTKERDQLRAQVAERNDAQVKPSAQPHCEVMNNDQMLFLHSPSAAEACLSRNEVNQTQAQPPTPQVSSAMLQRPTCSLNTDITLKTPQPIPLFELLRHCARSADPVLPTMAMQDKPQHIVKTKLTFPCTSLNKIKDNRPLLQTIWPISRKKQLNQKEGKGIGTHSRAGVRNAPPLICLANLRQTQQQCEVVSKHIAAQLSYTHSTTVIRPVATNIKHTTKQQQDKFMQPYSPPTGETGKLVSPPTAPDTERARAPTTISGGPKTACPVTCRMWQPNDSADTVDANTQTTM